jgi:FG-GAP-like repeat/FG-GAP repeat
MLNSRTTPIATSDLSPAWSFVVDPIDAGLATAAFGRSSAPSPVADQPIVPIAFRQIGADLDGEAANDLSGNAVSLSADGKTLAIGAYFNDGGGNDSGAVRVYQNLAGTWTPFGADINGERSGDVSGFSVSLADDGKTVAIGAISNDDNGSDSGSVRIYRNQAGTWSQIGADLDGEAIDDQSGYAVSLSGDGTTVAIGAYFNDGNGANSGSVRIYRNQAGTWTRLGGDLDGAAAGDQAGNAVAMSVDGNVVAIASRFNAANGFNSGAVTVYRQVAGSWVVVGTPIPGEVAGDTAGNAVALSANGNVVAIGSSANDGGGNDAGSVRVYQNIAGTWVKIGGDIDGVAPGDLAGWSVALSVDGNTVAVGARGSDGRGVDSGAVRVYRNFLGNWRPITADILGEATGDQSGWSIALSDDGNTVAVGAYLNAGNGPNSGSTRVYEYVAPRSNDLFWRNQTSGVGVFWSVQHGTELWNGLALTYGAGFTDGRAGGYALYGADWKLVGTADMNGDRVNDLVYANQNTIRILTLGKEYGQTAIVNTETSPIFASSKFGGLNGQVATLQPGWQLIGLADMNGDAQADLVFHSKASDRIVYWAMNDRNQIIDGGVVTSAANPAGQGTGGGNSGWEVMGLGDFDGDRDPDILWRNGGATVLWRLNSQQQLVGGGLLALPMPQSFTLRGIGDLNGDGVQDVVWRDTAANVTVLWSFNATGIPTQTTLPAAGGSRWQVEGIADMNGDGTDDVIWRDRVDDRAVVWNMQNGQLLLAGSGYVRNFLNGRDGGIVQTGDRTWTLEFAKLA